MFPGEYCLMALRFDCKAISAARVASLLVAFLTYSPMSKPVSLGDKAAGGGERACDEIHKWPVNPTVTMNNSKQNIKQTACFFKNLNVEILRNVFLTNLYGLDYENTTNYWN